MAERRTVRPITAAMRRRLHYLELALVDMSDEKGPRLIERETEQRQLLWQLYSAGKVKDV